MAGTIVVSNLNDGTNTGNTTDMIKGSARAWVNFNGTGTVAIRAAYNVSSITDNGVGDYTVNFTNAMPDANYSEIVGSGITLAPVVSAARAFCTGNRLSTSIAVAIADNGGDTAFDMEVVNVAIFR